MAFEYISVKETAQKMNVTERWIQQLCKDGKIEGTIRLGGTGPWLVPLSWINKNNFQREAGNYDEKTNR